MTAPGAGTPAATAPGRAAPVINAHPHDYAEEWLDEAFEPDDSSTGVSYDRENILDAYAAGWDQARALVGSHRVAELVSEGNELRGERDRLADALAGNPDPLVAFSRSQVEHFRELVAEILDALDHGGPFYAERWRERAGLTEDGGGGRDAKA